MREKNKRYPDQVEEKCSTLAEVVEQTVREEAIAFGVWLTGSTNNIIKSEYINWKNKRDEEV